MDLTEQDSTKLLSNLKTQGASHLFDKDGNLTYPESADVEAELLRRMTPAGYPAQLLDDLRKLHWNLSPSQNSEFVKLLDRSPSRDGAG